MDNLNFPPPSHADPTLTPRLTSVRPWLIFHVLALAPPLASKPTQVLSFEVVTQPALEFVCSSLLCLVFAPPNHDSFGLFYDEQHKYTVYLLDDYCLLPVDQLDPLPITTLLCHPRNKLRLSSAGDEMTRVPAKQNISNTLHDAEVVATN